MCPTGFAKEIPGWITYQDYQPGALLNFQSVDNLTELFRACVHLLVLLRGERRGNLCVHAIATNQCKSRKAYIMQTVFTVHHGGNGQGSAAAVKDALADMTYGDGHCIEGCTLVLDYLCARLLYKIFNCLMVTVPMDELGVGHVVLIVVNLVVGNGG